MKKILFILPSLCVGGLERVQVTVANKLADAGYLVTVMTFDEGDDLRCELSDKVRFIYKEPKPFQLMRKIPYIRYKFYDNGLWETRASAKQLYKYYVGNEKYDAEIAFFRGRAVKIISGSTNKASRKIAWVHTDFCRTDSWMANFQSKEKVQLAYKSFNSIICVSKQAAEGFKAVFEYTDNIHTIYNMLPVFDIMEKSNEKPTARINKSQFHIVLVGHYINTTKGQGRLISAVCKLRNEGVNISLALIGNGKDKNLFRSTINEKGAGKYITLIDGGKNPYPYIKEADLLVCASYYEGYNLTVAEALILGTPVLSTDCTGPNEILDYGKYGMIVENSEEGVYNGLRQFVDNPDLLKEYKEKALQRQDFFDEEKILKQITDLF